MGKLATLTPVLSPMLWTSIATGKRPYQHGILGFAEPDPDKGGVRPITNLSRKTKAIWNILGQEGLKSNVIGWWPSHPVEPINGVMVSNHYQQVRDQDGKWPMLSGTVHPPELASRIAQFRVHPNEIEGEQILPFVPRAREIDQEKDKRCWQIAKLLSECASVHACATAVMQNEEWDFMGIYYDAVDHFCHGFMRFHPPQQDHIDQKDFDLYRDVVEGIYQFHDAMLGVTLKLAGEDATVILMSDHGFHPDHLRPKEIPHEPNGPAVEHSHHGIFVAKGPGLKKDATVFGANLLDITPTLLALFDLPVGDDMDGRPLTSIWEKTPKIKSIPSWEEVEGDDGRHPSHFRFDPEDDRELMNQLVELGYVEDHGEDEKEGERKALRELQFNLARAYVDGARHGDSIPILEKLVEEWPLELRFMNQLAFSYLTLNQPGETRRILEKMVAAQAILKEELKVELPELRRDFEGKDEKELSEEDQNRIKRMRGKIASANAPQHFLLGCLLVAEDQPEKAVAVFELISEESWTNSVLPVRMGHLHMSIGQDERAGEYFEKGLKIDPQCSRAYQGLMQLMLKLGRHQEAAEYGLTSVGLLYFSPMSHFLLGKALVALKKYERAVEAFEVAVAQNPNFLEAYEFLGDLYHSFLRQEEKADRYFRKASELIQARKLKEKEELAGVSLKPVSERLDVPDSWPDEKIITIVSGLPRSGTSLMMQMLKAGGLVCFTDEVRVADENNPKGYFELESVKELHRDSSVLDGAGGKVVKVVAPIIPRLPEGEEYRYRVVFIERDLDEVYASQVAMLKRLGKPAPKGEASRMKNSYAKLIAQVNDVLEAREIPTIRISFGETIASPMETVTRLHSFCGGTLNEAAMAASVDASLHRERNPG